MLRCFHISLLLAATVLAACGGSVEQITILHLNDLHARLLPDDSGRGGFAHVATAIATERGNSVNPLVLHGGDMVQGSPVSTLFKGVPVYRVGNQLGIDVHCLGNHEFDYGWEKIREFVSTSTAPIVSANVINSSGDTLLTPYVVRSVGDLKVAVIGALTEQLANLIKSNQSGPWRAAPLVDTLRPVIAQARREADLVVVLGHLFDDEDEMLLRELPGVDVLVSGHNHGGRQEALVIDGRICVKVRSYGRELGRLDLEFDTTERRVVSHNWRRIAIDTERYSADSDTAILVDDWESRVAEIVDVPVGECRKVLRKNELQAAIERALRDETGADIAYMNPGGIRDSMPKGTVMARHVWNIIPFDNEVVEAFVKGADLPREVKRGRRFDNNRTYHLVTNDFVADQWSERGFDFKPAGRTLRDAFLSWIKARKTLP